MKWDGTDRLNGVEIGTKLVGTVGMGTCCYTVYTPNNYDIPRDINTTFQEVVEGNFTRRATVTCNKL